MTITSHSDFWGSSYAPVNDNATMRRGVARVLNRKMLRKDRELLVELLGVAAGETALVQHTRVAHNTEELGGVRTIETVDVLNRVTTAADVTDLVATLLSYTSTLTTYPTDKAQLA